MSENFNGKDYGEYFRSLEKKLAASGGRTEPEPGKANSARSEKSKGVKYRVIHIRPKAFIFAFILIFVIAAAVITVPVITSGKGKNAQPQSGNVSNIRKDSGETEENNTGIIYSFSDETAEIPESNDSEAAIVVNTSTHEIVAARNAHERLYPASTAKIMTLIVASENITDYSDTFTMTLDITDPLYVAGASVAGFLKDEIISMTDLLYGLILPSGADAAMGLAEKISGSESAFVRLMNEKAEELGLEDTHFSNASGLFDSEQYTSAYDMAIILETAIQDPLRRKILSTYQYTTAPTPQHPEGIALSSTLFDYMYGTEPETATIQGGKTGFINEAGYCIASYGANNTTGNEYIVVTLKNSSRNPAIFGQIDLYKQFAE